VDVLFEKYKSGYRVVFFTFDFCNEAKESKSLFQLFVDSLVIVEKHVRTTPRIIIVKYFQSLGNEKINTFLVGFGYSRVEPRAPSVEPADSKIDFKRKIRNAIRFVYLTDKMNIRENERRPYV